MKNRIYLILYYVAFILTFTLCLNTIQQINFSNTDQIMNYGPQNYFNILTLIIVNAILFVMFTIGIITKKEYKNNNIVIPTSYIVFYLIILIICLLYDKIVIVPFLHYAYYELFLLFAYLMFNIYSLLGFEYKKKKLSKK